MSDAGKTHLTEAESAELNGYFIWIMEGKPADPSLRCLPRAMALTPAGLIVAAIADRYDRGEPAANGLEAIIRRDWEALDRG